MAWIQGEKVGGRENFLNPVLAVPFIPAGMVTSIASLLGVAATGQAITTYLQNNPSAIDTVKKALEMSGKMTGVLPFGTYQVINRSRRRVKRIIKI